MSLAILVSAAAASSRRRLVACLAVPLLGFAALLAAATDLATGGDGCSRASRIATGNGASLRSCTIDGDTALVEVEVAGPAWLGWSGDLAARARAGPGP